MACRSQRKNVPIFKAAAIAVALLILVPTVVGAESLVDVTDSGAASASILLVREAPRASDPLGVVGIDLDREAYDELWSKGRTSIASFPLPGRLPVNLELESFELLAPDARFVVVDERGERELPAPRMRFFRGRVSGNPGSLVSLGLHEGRITGFIRAWGEEFGIAPRKSDEARAGIGEMRVWNRRLAGDEPIGPICGESLPARSGPPREFRRGSADPPPGGIDGNTRLVAQIALDATKDWFDHFGSAGAAQTYMLNLMAQVSTIYDVQLRITLEVPYVRVFAAEPDPYTDGTTNTSVLLNEIQAEWNANQTGVSRTVAHVFQVRPPLSAAGLAFVDVLCDNNFSPGNSSDYGSLTMPGLGNLFELGLVAHELGHNFSSPHTNCYSPEIDQCFVEPGCYSGPTTETVSTIMSRCDTSIDAFHPRVENEKIRPAAEAAFGTCVEAAGLPGAIRDGVGGGLRVSRPVACPPQAFQNDDGFLDSATGYLGTAQAIWVKRFTPACVPFLLTGAEVLIGQTGLSNVSPGRPLRVVVYVDPSGSGDPANASLVYTEDVTVQVTGSSVFNAYTLSTPVSVNAGDVYVGFFDLDADASDTFIVAIDSSASGDSWLNANSTSASGLSPLGGVTAMIRATGGPVDPAGIGLDWDAPCNDADVPGQDFAVYRGSIGAFASHDSLTCTTDRDTTFFDEVAPDNSFYLVVPQTSAAEGSYGLTGAGTERPPAAIACKPTSPATCP